MSTYKVIQDVEAEDKILGPLTLRQFIYAGIAAVCLYLTYFSSTHSAGFLSILFLPVALVTGFFAFPWGRDQPTEVWALAKIRFALKPRRRIWDQSGAKELVTVTAPKKVDVDYTNGLSQTEVRSRLHALADTLDSRGWAIKNANINMLAPQAMVMAQPASDRLVGINEFAQAVTPVDVRPADDILDEQNNPVAQQVDTMIAASAKAHREKIMASLRQDAPAPAQPAPAANAGNVPANNYWFLNQPAQSASVPNDMVTFNTQVVSPGMQATDAPIVAAPANTPDEQQLVQTLEAKKQELPTTAYYGHLHVVQPLSAQTGNAGMAQTTPAQPQVAAPYAAPPQYGAPQVPPVTPQAQPPVDSPVAAPVAPVTPAQQAAILQLANNDDLNVATIAREAQRSGGSDGEVVIKLH